jgi:hypothetical protein
VIVGEIESERENVCECVCMCVCVCDCMCGRMSVCSRSISFITDEAIFPAEIFFPFFYSRKGEKGKAKGD